MLVLARKKNESIVIGDAIEITVVDIQGDQVRLGIRAPKEVTIYRQEIFREIQKANQSAAQTSSAGLDEFRRLLSGFGPGKPDGARP